MSARKSTKKSTKKSTTKIAKKTAKKTSKKSAKKGTTLGAPKPAPKSTAKTDTPPGSRIASVTRDSTATSVGGLLGAHISSAGGPQLTPGRGDEIGATAIQLFTKTPNQWREPEIDAETAAAFRTALAASGVRFTTSHDSYLINLASPDATLRARSIDSFTRELRRCHALGLDAVVSHPGNFIDDRASGLARNAEGITEALEAAPGPTRLCMELTAGQGTVLGSTFEEMAALLARIPTRLQHRLGVCLDTAHVFAAGYDLIADYDGVWTRFADVIGLERLGVLHLNDSAVPFDSRKDRHALIGEGHIGDAPFRRIMTDPRLRDVPKILETPKGDDMVTNDRRMLAKLRGFAAA